MNFWQQHTHHDMVHNYKRMVEWEKGDRGTGIMIVKNERKEIEWNVLLSSILTRFQSVSWTMFASNTHTQLACTHTNVIHASHVRATSQWHDLHLCQYSIVCSVVARRMSVCVCVSAETHQGTEELSVPEYPKWNCRTSAAAAAALHCPSVALKQFLIFVSFFLFEFSSASALHFRAKRSLKHSYCYCCLCCVCVCYCVCLSVLSLLISVSFAFELRNTI